MNATTESKAACTDCGCDESRGCLQDGHRVCHLVPAHGDLPTLCSHCLSRRGYVDLRGTTLRHTLVDHALMMHGRPGVEKMNRDYPGNAEITRALASCDSPCPVCGPGTRTREESSLALLGWGVPFPGNAGDAK